MAIIKTNYSLPGSQEDNPYLIAEDDEENKKWKKRMRGSGSDIGLTLDQPIVDTDEDNEDTDVTGETDDNTADTGETDTPEIPVTEETETTQTGEEDSYTKLLKQIEEMTKSGSISEQYKAAILSAIEAQKLTTQQAIDQLEYQKEQANTARKKSNREADLTFSRAINPTGKINQNIRSSGLAGSGWQETSQVGLTNAYQNSLNTNTSDYNQSIRELNLSISQAKQSGDIATLQAIQTYVIQLAQQLYQEARDAVSDAQWEKSYALQKAAYDLENAASSSNYYYNTGLTSRSSEDSAIGIVDAATSKTSAANAGYEIEQMLASGTTGEDVKYYTAQIIEKYSSGMNDAYIQWLLDTYGLTQEELEYYTQ